MNTQVIKMRNKLVLLISIFLFFSSHRLFATEIVLYGTFKDSYQFELLKHALSYSPENNYQISNFNNRLPKDRAFDFMNKNEHVDVIFGGATIEREQKALPIRIPILKGINGWRVPLVNKKKHPLFKQVNSIEQFRKLVPGQFHTWSDTKVLESNNIRVEKGADFEGLFLMLDKERFDYFPRSVLEVDHEYEAHKILNITIDNSVLVHYPTANYFYVAKNNQALAKIITFGLEQALADGSFDQLFFKYFAEVIDRVKKNNVKIFSLKNPYLSEKAPLARKELWIPLPSSSSQIIM